MIMTDRLRAKGPWWEMSPYVRSREAFKTGGALYAEGPKMPGYWAEGRLHPSLRGSLAQADYVVYSYGTPIAWHLRADYAAEAGHTWVVPAVKYSVTTSAHQNKIRTCLDAVGYVDHV
jgi:hypothetical protein